MKINERKKRDLGLRQQQRYRSQKEKKKAASRTWAEAPLSARGSSIPWQRVSSSKLRNGGKVRKSAQESIRNVSYSVAGSGVSALPSLTYFCGEEIKKKNARDGDEYSRAGEGFADGELTQWLALKKKNASMACPRWFPFFFLVSS